MLLVAYKAFYPIIFHSFIIICPNTLLHKTREKCFILGEEITSRQNDVFCVIRKIKYFAKISNF